LKDDQSEHRRQIDLTDDQPSTERTKIYGTDFIHDVIESSVSQRSPTEDDRDDHDVKIYPQHLKTVIQDVVEHIIQSKKVHFF
jgi:hypothetical protein